MGGGQILVKNGKNVAPAYYSGAPYILNYNPRTGVGISEGCSDADPLTECSMTLITVDGRQTSTNWSKGIRLPQFAGEFIKVGSWDALNLDGGGSTTMWVQKQNAAYCELYPVVGGCVVNRPITSSSGGERSIRTALVVLPGSDAGTPTGLG
jgi:exopolysaccharide biosynthesis protein